ncbi:TPA: hypothetical protein ACIQN5_001299 [Bacillus cereus]
MKQIDFPITGFRSFSTFVNEPIRNKEDIIRVLLYSMKNLLLKEQLEDEELGSVSVIIDQTSRLYFLCKNSNELPNKYYSFVFPFFLEIDNTSNNCTIKCKNSSEIISSELIDALIRLLDTGWFSENNLNSDTLDKFACDYLENISDFYGAEGILSEEEDLLDIAHWSIIKTLLTFEPSYMRYDFDDSDRADERSHPIHHLDVHYNSSGTFKLGLNLSIPKNQRLDWEIFKDIFNNGKARDNDVYRLG